MSRFFGCLFKQESIAARSITHSNYAKDNKNPLEIERNRGPILANFYIERCAGGIHLPLGAHFFVVAVSAVVINFIVSVACCHCCVQPFANSGPFLWNKLPLEVRSSSSVTGFKAKLKTHLSKQAYNLF